MGSLHSYVAAGIVRQDVIQITVYTGISPDNKNPTNRNHGISKRRTWALQWVSGLRQKTAEQVSG